MKRLIFLLACCHLVVMTQNGFGYAKQDLEKLLKTKICQKCDLKGADLKGTDLKGADLQKTILDQANLSGANLTGANLHGVTYLNTFFEMSYCIVKKIASVAARNLGYR